MEKELKLETNNTYNRMAHPRTGPLSTGEGGGRGPYGKAELALLYFPGSSPDVARAKLMRAINRNKAWSRAMARTGYYTTAKEFTPKQVEVIFHYYGEPG